MAIQIVAMGVVIGVDLRLIISELEELLLQLTLELPHWYVEMAQSIALNPEMMVIW